MKISYSWLKEYIKTDLSPEEVGEILTDTGLEVEGIEEVESVKGGLKGIVVGEVLTCEKHPNADKLSKTTVNVGGADPLNIVCGAPNVKAGQKVLVATVGTVLYDGDDSFKIKKSKIRGEASEGMICAEDELGLGDSHDGIMVLDADAPVGVPASEFLDIKSDHVIEIGLTPNRTDAMSHYGVARDLRAAILHHRDGAPDLDLPSVSSFSVQSNELPVEVIVEDTEACPRYSGVSLKNVKVAPSPEWLQNRLKAIGLNPVNNIVDITNYVLHETGHPLHAFDLDEVRGNKIIVKQLPAGTKFTTLDDKERELHSEDLMICDESEGLCIAGVLGGAQSGVTEKTTSVFLESAFFNPVSVRKTAKRHGLNTDASFRYERGVDHNMNLYALKRAAILIRDIADAEISMEVVDVYPKPLEDYEVSINLDRVNNLIGQEIDVQEVRNILTSLDIKIRAEAGREMSLVIPFYRFDVRREADVVEEILRIYGFNAIEAGERMNISVANYDKRSEAHYRERTSVDLSARGFAEIMNNSLIRGSYFESNGFDADQSVQILNPLSQDLGVLRQSLVFGGLEVIAHNSNRQRHDLRLYEFGSVYAKEGEGYREGSRLGIWMSGNKSMLNWQVEAERTDFFNLKSEVQGILAGMGFSEWEETDYEHEIFDHALAMTINKQVVVSIGKISAALTAKMNIKQEIFYADFDWTYLAKKAKKKKITFSELPKYPEVRRDLALLLDKDVSYAALKAAAERTERKILREVNLFDVYEGKNLPSGKKSYAMSFILRDDQATLNDVRVDKTMQKIQSTFEKDFGATLR